MVGCSEWKTGKVASRGVCIAADLQALARRTHFVFASLHHDAAHDALPLHDVHRLATAL